MTVYTRTRQQIGIPLLGRQIGRVSGVVIHHWTSHWTSPSATISQEVAAIQAIHAYHRSTGRHGGGYGYSGTVCASGRIYEGRGAFRSGAHTIGWNSSRLAIVVPGNTNIVQVTNQQVAGIRELIGYWQSIGALTDSYSVDGHGGLTGSTACPGADARSKLGRFRGVTGPAPAPEPDPAPDPDPEPEPEPEDDMSVYGPPLTVVRSTDPADNVRKTYVIRNWTGEFFRVTGDGIRIWTDRAERDDIPHVEGVRTDWDYGWFAGMRELD